MTDSRLTHRAKRLGWIGWTVIAVLVGGSAVAAAANSTSNSSNNNAGNTGHPITVSGTSPTGLSPGVTKPVTVTVTNPNNQDAQVTSVTITVGNASASCPAAGNVTTTSYDSSTKGAAVYTARKNASVQVPLSITMLDKTIGQNACKGAAFPLTFTATVTNNS